MPNEQLDQTESEVPTGASFSISMCNSFYEMLDYIESIGSTLAKEEAIKYTIQNRKNAEAFYRLAFNDTVYGVSEKSFYNALAMRGVTPVPGTTFPHVSDYLHELEYIGTAPSVIKIPEFIDWANDLKLISGDAQLGEIYSFFVGLSAAKKKWWCRAILHDLRMGANVKTINSVFKELGLKPIDKFALQLAEKIDIYNPEDVAKKIKLPCVMERKYDGLRIIAEVFNNTCTLKSRRGKDRTADFPEIVTALLSKFQDQCVILDGEIVKFYESTAIDFNESFQGVMKKDGEGEIRYVCFDLLIDESMDYKYRWSNLESVWDNTMEEDSLVLSEHYNCNKIEEAQEYFEDLLKNGREGIMLKKLDSAYERGTRKHMFKCKPDYVPSMQKGHEADLLITEWKFGSGKNHELVGTLCLQDASKTINVDVGSGIDDSTRIMLTEMKDKLIGMICEIRYNEKTETGALRFPRFITLRDDKEIPDDLSER